MHVQIETSGQDLLLSIFGVRNPNKGDKVAIDGGADLYLESASGIAAFDFSGVIDFTLAFSSGVSASIVANWLWQKLQGKALSINIDGVKVKIDENDIKRLLADKISAELNGR